MMPPGSLEQVVFRMDALHRVAAAGVPVWNPPRAVEAAVDKYLTLALLDQAGLPVPPTWTGQSAAEALAAFEALGGDVVVKPLFGSEGRGLVRVSDKELAWRTFHTLERLGAVLYLQRMIRHPGHDLRVFVLGGRVLGSDAPVLAGTRVAHERVARRAGRALPARRRRGTTGPGGRPGHRGRDGRCRPDGRPGRGKLGRARSECRAGLAGTRAGDRHRRGRGRARGAEGCRR